MGLQLVALELLDVEQNSFSLPSRFHFHLFYFLEDLLSCCPLLLSKLHLHLILKALPTMA
jgi:hypothetical protein